jgi:hypothetical protein
MFFPASPRGNANPPVKAIRIQLTYGIHGFALPPLEAMRIPLTYRTICISSRTICINTPGCGGKPCSRKYHTHLERNTASCESSQAELTICTAESANKQAYIVNSSGGATYLCNPPTSAWKSCGLKPHISSHRVSKQIYDDITN